MCRYFFFYLIFIATIGIAHDQLSDKTGQKQLRTQQHCCQRQVKIRRIRNKNIVVAVMHVVQFCEAYNSHGNKTQEKHKASEQSEKVHRLNPEARGKPKCCEIKITVYKAVESKFSSTVLPGLMMHYLFSYAVESGIFAR